MTKPAVPRKHVSKHIDLARDGLAIEAEYMQTPFWAIEAILRAEILTNSVVDPCCGDGRMAEMAKGQGYLVTAYDLHDWGYEFGHCGPQFNFLARTQRFDHGLTVFMNPPFSLACAFVDKARELGARKIVCFQRQVWRECRERKEWWESNPYNRRYVCGDRAICWYGTIPEEERIGGAYQPHAFYVWEQGHPPGALEGTIWKDKK